MRMRKRKSNRMISLLCSAVIVLSAVFGSYETAQATSIAAIGTFEFFQTLFLNFGITVGLADYFNKSAEDRKVWEEKLNDKMFSDYDKIVSDYISENPDSVPMSLDDIRTQVTQDEIFNLIDMGVATVDCLGKLISDFWDDALNIINVNSAVPVNAVNIITTSSYPYYTYFTQSSSGHSGFLYLWKEGSFLYSSQTYVYGGYIEYHEDSSGNFNLFESYDFSQGTTSDFRRFYNWYSNLFNFSTKEEGMEWRDSILSGYSPSKSDIWVNPDLVGPYAGNDNLVLPDTIPPAIRVPSLEELENLSNQGNESNDDDRPIIIQEFINAHTVNPEPDPTIVPDPDPGTDPEPSVSPEPTFSPGETDPTIVPPNPDDPDPSGTPDNPDLTGTPDDPGSEELPKEDYLAEGLRNFFPFCIPWDLASIFTNFTADRRAPCFTFPLKIDRFGIDETITVDLSVFDEAAALLRTLELILFVVLLAVASRKLIGAL